MESGDLAAGGGEAPLLLCLVGIDGSGKSTHAERLRTWIEDRHEGRRVRICGVWDILVDPELNRTAFMGSPDDLRRYLLAIEPDARTLFIFHALLESYRRAVRAGDQVVILTGYWYKYFVTECLLGAHEPLLEPIVRLFAEPDVTLFLDVDPTEAAARRAGDHSGYECGGVEPSEEAFIAFQTRCRRKLVGLQGSREWVHLDASGSEDDVFERIRHFLVERDGRF